MYDHSTINIDKLYLFNFQDVHLNGPDSVEEQEKRLDSQRKECHILNYLKKLLCVQAVLTHCIMYIPSYYVKWIKTSWTYSKLLAEINQIYVHI